MLTTAIILPIIIVAVKLLLNYQLWEKGKPVKHTKEWWIMAVGCVPSIVLFTKLSPVIWYIVAPVSAAMIAFFIWLFFDGLYNVIRKFNWWFPGSNDADDAKTDNFLQRLKLWQHVAIKVGGLILFITLYIFL